MREISLLKLIGGLSALCMLGLAPAAWAHHAASGFNMNQPYIFKAEVRKFAWVNPHAFLYADVQKANGSKELWGFETGGPSILNRQGWKLTDFPAGAKVTIYAYASRKNGDRNALMTKVVLADGRELKSLDIGLPPASTPGEAPTGPGQASTAAPPPAPPKKTEYTEYK